MIDVDGKRLEIGDIVAHTVTGRPELKLGRVERFTARKIVVGYSRLTKAGRTDYSDHKFPYQVCYVRKPTAVESGENISCMML
jgi:hypothetical protein